jgi:hypothetical protein
MRSASQHHHIRRDETDPNNTTAATTRTSFTNSIRLPHRSSINTVGTTKKMDQAVKHQLQGESSAEASFPPTTPNTDEGENPQKSPKKKKKGEKDARMVRDAPSVATCASATVPAADSEEGRQVIKKKKKKKKQEKRKAATTEEVSLASNEKPSIVAEEQQTFNVIPELKDGDSSHATPRSMNGTPVSVPILTNRDGAITTGVRVQVTFEDERLEEKAQHESMEDGAASASFILPSTKSTRKHHQERKEKRTVDIFVHDKAQQLSLGCDQPTSQATQSKKRQGRISKKRTAPPSGRCLPSATTDVDSEALSTISGGGNLLTVFQAAPLAYVGRDGTPVPLCLLDFEKERNLLTKTLEESGAPIHVDFQIATVGALSMFLAREDGSAIHFSCHGHEKYLSLEDGRGGMHQLITKDLKEWIARGGRNLKFVFVSACHSSLIGQAFVDAGVPHVVCCRQDSEVLDEKKLEGGI